MGVAQLPGWPLSTRLSDPARPRPRCAELARTQNRLRSGGAEPAVPARKAPLSRAGQPGTSGTESRGKGARLRQGLSLHRGPGREGDHRPLAAAKHPPAKREARERSERPREPGPPSAGGTSARGTARRGRAYMFVQRRLHLAASLISGCGLR